MAERRGGGSAVCLARHGAREDYAQQKLGRNWMTGQERPWDPPLTEEGVEQGAALGAGLKEHCERLGLPPVTRVISSPLTRCLQTAAAAARSLGLREICVEPSLTEGMLEEWYRSWAVPGADSTWGGPIHARCGVPLPEGAKLFPGATGPASSLLFGPAEAQEALRRHGVSDVGVSSEYEALNPSGESFTQCWDHFETESALADRMQTTLEALGRRYPDETILLCSHGGPCAKAYGRLLGTRAQKLNAGYTALYIFVRAEEEESGWDAPVAASQTHLERLQGRGPLGGPNDASEQKT